MMGQNKVGLWFLLSVFGIGLPLAPSFAYSLTANEIYRQANHGNTTFLHRLSRYQGAIDLQNYSGNTAYCLALRYNDTQAQNLLENYGANTHHSCVQKVNEQKEQYAQSRTRKNAIRPSSSSYYKTDDSGNNYLWWGLGALAVGGGVAALSSGGGGGSDSSHFEGEISGPPVDSDKKPTISADVFKTQEYSKGNFLDAINAAEAYSYMYSKDDKGNLISHQANSDEQLKKVKVAVVDTGVYSNADLAEKIVGAYDVNDYNHQANIWTSFKAANGFQSYIFFKNGSYYFVQAKPNEKDATQVYMNVGRSENGSYELSETELNKVLADYGLTKDEFSLVNSGNAADPGTSLINKFDIYDLDTVLGVISNINHGTHVAGIVAGNKNDSGMHGVAFENAQIVAVSWDLENNISEIVKTLTDNGVKVFNNSWGTPANSIINADNASLIQYSDDAKAYAYAAKGGAVWVQATGNEGLHNSAIQTGLPTVDLSHYGYAGPGKYEVPFLAVAALDYSTKDANAPSGYMANYSNWCGSAAGYCLAAPGSTVESTGAVDEGTLAESGTSMATPVVSGSVALLMGYYPWLSAQNIAYILLETANDKGEYANSQKYGQGALDLEAAVTTPIGGLGLPTSASFNSLSSAGLSKLSLSSAMQNKILKVLPKSVTAFDALNRPFQYNTENLVNETHASNANFRNAVSRMAAGSNKKVIKDEKTGFSFSSSETLDNGGKANLASMEVVNETDKGATRFYYAQNSKFDTPENVLTPSTNPYLAMNEAYGAENTMKLSDTSKFKLALQTGENGLFERDYEQDNHSFTERSYAFSGEYSFNMTDYLELATMGGMLMENDALLGMNGTGGFGIKDSSTYYMGIRAALNLTPNLSLIAAYYRGYTQGADTPMLAISDLQTESFMLAGEYRLNAKDKIGLSLSSPLSVVKGRASLLYASGRDNNSDTIYMNKLNTSLTPEAKEYDLGLYYQGQPKEDLSLMGKVQARFNADGEKGVTDYIGILGVQSNF